MMALCKCGCGEPAPLADKTERARGYVKGQPRDFVHGHNGRRSSQRLKIADAGYSTPCWLWLGTKTRDGGYGQIRAEGKMRPVHRVYYEYLVGPIPNGLELDHRCRNKTCVNPAHLEPVTSKENVTRHWRHKFAGATGLRARRLELGLSQDELAQQLGCAQTTVSKWERGVRTVPKDVWMKLSPTGEVAA